MGEMSCSCIVLPEFSVADMVTLASFSGVFCRSLGISPLSGLSSVPGPVLSHHPQRRHSSPKSCRWASVTGPVLLLACPAGGRAEMEVLQAVPLRGWQRCPGHQALLRLVVY